jgi:hypothetical protein
MDQYISFCKSIYRNDPWFRDSSLTGVLRRIGFGNEPYFRGAGITPLLVRDGNAILAACTLIVFPKCPDVLRFSYFEARPGCQAAVDMLMAAACRQCSEQGLRRILVGVDSTVGILTDRFDCVPCYGTRYNPGYYTGYFSSYPGQAHLLASYLIDPERCMERERHILKRIADRFTCRPADWRRLEREAGAYTMLKNRCFAGQPFFARSSTELNYRMFRSFGTLISGQNLLFLEKDGVPIGYLLWFPDYNQLLAPGETMDADMLRKYRLYGHTIDKFTVSEIGVLPEYQGTGAVLALFDLCLRLIGERYEWCEPGWIMSGNMRSKGFGIRWAEAEYKHYRVFEIDPSHL